MSMTESRESYPALETESGNFLVRIAYDVVGYVSPEGECLRVVDEEEWEWAVNAWQREETTVGLDRATVEEIRDASSSEDDTSEDEAEQSRRNPRRNRRTDADRRREHVSLLSPCDMEKVTAAVKFIEELDLSSIEQLAVFDMIDRNGVTRGALFERKTYRAALAKIARAHEDEHGYVWDASARDDEMAEEVLRFYRAFSYLVPDNERWVDFGPADLGRRGETLLLRSGSVNERVREITPEGVQRSTTVSNGW